MLAREGDGWRLLSAAKLIYVRLEADDSVRLEKPHFCPRCSRLALSLGVAEWIFALSEGLVGYSAADYDAISQLGWLRRGGPAAPARPARRGPPRLVLGAHRAGHRGHGRRLDLPAPHRLRVQHADVGRPDPVR